MMEVLKPFFTIIALAAFSVMVGLYAGNALALLHVTIFATGTVDKLAVVYGLLSTVSTFGGCLKVVYDEYD